MRAFLFGMGVTMAITMLIYAIGMAVLSNTAFPHGIADWILKTKYSACCGPIDCKIVHVKYDGSGWVFENPFLPGTTERVPDDGNKIGSIDDHFWACFNIYGDKRLRTIPTPGTPYADQLKTRCFFAPEAGV